jgi:hypothetical protein
MTLAAQSNVTTAPHLVGRAVGELKRTGTDSK